jgi:hypothetical protein
VGWGRVSEVCCRWCHQVDRNEFLHRNNHGQMGAREGICLAQYLRANHVRHMTKHNDLDKLMEYIERAEQIWQHIPGPHEFLTAAYARVEHLRAMRAPIHHAVPLSEDADLFGAPA